AAATARPAPRLAATALSAGRAARRRRPRLLARPATPAARPIAVAAARQAERARSQSVHGPGRECGPRGAPAPPAPKPARRPRVTRAHRARDGPEVRVLRRRLPVVVELRTEFLVVEIVEVDRGRLAGRGGSGVAAVALGFAKDPPERADLASRQFGPAAARQAARHADGTEAHPHEPAHREADGLEHAAHLAVATLGDHHAIPGIGPLATQVVDARERRLAVIEIDALQQLLPGLLVDAPEDAHGV